MNRPCNESDPYKAKVFLPVAQRWNEAKSLFKCSLRRVTHEQGMRTSLALRGRCARHVHAEKVRVSGSNTPNDQPLRHAVPFSLLRTMVRTRNETTVVTVLKRLTHRSRTPVTSLKLVQSEWFPEKVLSVSHREQLSARVSRSLSKKAARGIQQREET